MFFTQEDYRKIEKWLQERSVKDTDFKAADSLSNKDLVPIIQDDINKVTSIRDLAHKVNIPDFINVTTLINKGSLSLIEAINGVPADKRKLGLAITFHSAKGNWVIYQFNGANLNQWSSENCWKNIVEETYDELVIYRPDEEDITDEVIDGKSYLKFKDRHINIDKFIAKGKVILRKQITGTEACTLDNEDHLTNILTQDMLGEGNTIYVIRYNFNLNNETISVPSGSILVFDGGSINNGTLTLNGTKIIGASSYNELGDSINIIGSFAIGQIMTFTKEKVTTIKWYNGTDWKRLLDIEDYERVQSQITEIIDNYNAQQYTIKALESSLSSTNSEVCSLTEKFNEFENTFNDSVISVISEYLSNNDVGVTTIVINNKEYKVDSNHKITINDLSTKTIGALTVKTPAGDELGVFDGSENIEIVLPESYGSGEALAGKVLTIKDSRGNTLATYTGETEKTVKLPSAGSITFKGISNTDVVYNGVDDLVINLSTSQFGHSSLVHSGIVFAGTIKRNSIGRDGFYISSSIQPIIENSFKVSVSQYGKRLAVSFTPNDTVAQYSFCAATAQVAKFRGNSTGGDEIDSVTNTAGNAKDYVTVNIQTHINGNTVNMLGWEKNADNNVSTSSQGLYEKNRYSEVNEIYLIVYGTIISKLPQQ